MSAEEFLTYCNPYVIETIVSGVLKLFESRANSFRVFNPAVKLELSR